MLPAVNTRRTRRADAIASVPSTRDRNEPAPTETLRTTSSVPENALDGSRAFPGSSTLYFVALREGTRAGLSERLEALRTERGPEEGLRVYVLEAMEVI